MTFYLLILPAHPAMEKDFQIRKDYSRDGDILCGFYSKHQLACLFSERKRM